MCVDGKNNCDDGWVIAGSFFDKIDRSKYVTPQLKILVLVWIGGWVVCQVFIESNERENHDPAHDAVELMQASNQTLSYVMKRECMRLEKNERANAMSGVADTRDGSATLELMSACAIRGGFHIRMGGRRRQRVSRGT